MRGWVLLKHYRGLLSKGNRNLEGVFCYIRDVAAKCDVGTFIGFSVKKRKL